MEDFFDKEKAFFILMDALGEYLLEMNSDNKWFSEKDQKLANLHAEFSRELQMEELPENGEDYMD